MSDDIGNDPYAAVVADLRAKRDKLDEAIALIESIRGERLPTLARESRPEISEAGSADDAGQFLGMTIVDAAKKLLGAKRRTMSNPEIASALVQGGLVLKSVEPSNTVGSVLTRRFNEVGDIVRVSRGTWGLREWYPHTNFRKKDEGPSRDQSSKEAASHREEEPAAEVV